MSGTAGPRNTLIVAIAAAAGIVAAGGLLAGATLFMADGDTDASGSASATVSVADAPRRTNGPTSSKAAATDEDSQPTTEVTVDVPRSKQTPAPGLYPDRSPPTMTAPSIATVEPITDPQTAARTYLVAAETVTADDAGRHHRARPYMAPDNPAITSGLLVNEPPPAGHSRTVEVLDVVEQARNEERRRIAYRVTYQRHLSPTIPPTATWPDGEARVSYVVVERQAAGNWLVLSQTHDLDPVE